MSLISSIKQTLGIGGVKVSLNVPGQVEMSKCQVEGNVTLSAKSEQQVLELTVNLIESYSTGRGDEKVTRDFELGKVNLTEAPFQMKAGEVKEVPFVLPFKNLKSENDKLKEKGGALGMIGKAGAFANAEKSTYKMKAKANVKGTVLKPSDEKDIKLV